MKSILLAAIVLLACPLAAAEGSFGTVGGETVIDPMRLNAIGAGLPFPDGEGYVYPFSGTLTLQTGLELPNGAQVVEVCVHAIDSGDQAFVRVELLGYEYESTSPSSHRSFGFVDTGAAQVPGHTYDCFRPDPELVVHARDDLDKNGTPNYVSYRLEAFLNGSQMNRLGGIVVKWRRTLSPPPGTQTYDDVPIGSDYHAYVEALAAAGVTEGCVAGARFCPDAPLTRAQFALMLARALGLEWPQ